MAKYICSSSTILEHSLRHIAGGKKKSLNGRKKRCHERKKEIAVSNGSDRIGVKNRFKQICGARAQLRNKTQLYTSLTCTPAMIPYNFTFHTLLL